MLVTVKNSPPLRKQRWQLLASNQVHNYRTDIQFTRPLCGVSSLIYLSVHSFPPIFVHSHFFLFSSVCFSSYFSFSLLSTLLLFPLSFFSFLPSFFSFPRFSLCFPLSVSRTSCTSPHFLHYWDHMKQSNQANRLLAPISRMVTPRYQKWYDMSMNTFCIYGLIHDLMYGLICVNVDVFALYMLECWL